MRPPGASCSRSGTRSSANSEKARENVGFTRHMGRALPAETTQRRVDIKTLDQRRGGHQIEHRLRDKRARQRMAVIERAFGPAGTQMNDGLDANHLQQVTSRL
jgi:hypothetical protein